MFHKILHFANISLAKRRPLAYSKLVPPRMGGAIRLCLSAFPEGGHFLFRRVFLAATHNTASPSGGFGTEEPNMYEAGFIGAGNMGGALAQAAAKAVGAENIILTCKTRTHTLAAAERLGCASGSAEEIAKSSRFVFLGVKPQMLPEAAQALRAPLADADCVLVSMLAGVTLEKLEAAFPGVRILRIMPNTPCAVGSGMIQFCRGSLATERDAEEFRILMARAGRLDEIPEGLIDAASAVAGCGPAFAYMFVQALADGGVACGLPRAKATEYAAQMLLGSAQMVLSGVSHPEKLKDEVCSPGGSTIAGVQALENGAFRAACMNAVTAAFEKTKQLG